LDLIDCGLRSKPSYRGAPGPPASDGRAMREILLDVRKVHSALGRFRLLPSDLSSLQITPPRRSVQRSRMDVFRSSTKKPTCTAMLISVLVLGVMFGRGADATVLEETGGTACTGASASADARLSKLATGIANNSSSSVFVVCALQTVALHVPPNDSQRFNPVQIRFVNNGIRPATLKCTVVAMISPIDPVYIAGQAVAAVGGRGLLSINADTGRFSTSRISLGCLLPSRVTIESVSAQMTEFEFIPME
jgi:hypothetical protein